MRSYPGHAGIVEAVAFSPDGMTLASGGADGAVRIWNLIDGKQREEFHLDDNQQIGAATFSRDGRWLAWGGYGGHVRVLDGVGGSVTDWHNQGRVVGLAFAPGGKVLARASYDGVALCPFPGGHQPSALGGPVVRPFCLAFSPKGTEVAVGHKSSHVSLGDVRTRTVRALTHGQDEGCRGVSYSPDGRTLALALGDGVQLWNPADGRKVRELDGHDGVVSAVAFSPDGRRLVTCGWDGVARLYDAAGMGLIGSYDWKIGRLFCVAFSPDGTLAAAGGDRGDGLVAWDVE